MQIFMQPMQMHLQNTEGKRSILALDTCVMLRLTGLIHTLELPTEKAHPFYPCRNVPLPLSGAVKLIKPIEPQAPLPVLKPGQKPAKRLQRNKTRDRSNLEEDSNLRFDIIDTTPRTDSERNVVADIRRLYLYES